MEWSNNSITRLPSEYSTLGLTHGSTIGILFLYHIGPISVASKGVGFLCSARGDKNVVEAIAKYNVNHPIEAHWKNVTILEKI